ncbi:MAG: crossover junction endodeoxyribonuclease RuvC [Oscillospiraceae bacterium]|nr:crossover junction endodeoxyribonuclease RuvC [Oscillospiraceae bacterium]
MTILGVDPGIATVGFGVINADRNELRAVKYGAITTAPGRPLADRLVEIERDVLELLERFKPDAVSVEELFFNTNVTTGINVAHGRGVILLAAAKSQVPLFEYTPLQVKQAVVGYGRAEKKQVMDMTRRILRLQSVPKPDDAADALAVAICHARASTSLLKDYM